jgi:hypothetical protein
MYSQPRNRVFRERNTVIPNSNIITLFSHLTRLLYTMSNDRSTFFQSKLDELYAIIQDLRPTSSSEDFDKFASYLTPDCTAYLKSMNSHNIPATSRSEAIEDIQEVLGKYYIEERKVLFYALASDNHTMICETEKRINVMGETIESFPETEVVTFDDEGLIKVLKLYCCWSPIVRIVQDKTGKGPYSEGEVWEEFESHIKQMAVMRFQKRKAGVGEESVQIHASASCCS